MCVCVWGGGGGEGGKLALHKMLNLSKYELNPSKHFGDINN